MSGFKFIQKIKELFNIASPNADANKKQIIKELLKKLKLLKLIPTALRKIRKTYRH